MIDLTPACKRTANVLMNVTDEQLNGPTPCEKLSVRDLAAHVGGLALAFTAAARKEFGELTDTPPVEGVPLDENWRTAYPARLAELAAAWRALWEFDIELPCHRNSSFLLCRPTASAIASASM